MMSLEERETSRFLYNIDPLVSFNTAFPRAEFSYVTINVLLILLRDLKILQDTYKDRELLRGFVKAGQNVIYFL